MGSRTRSVLDPAVRHKDACPDLAGSVDGNLADPVMISSLSSQSCMVCTPWHSRRPAAVRLRATAGRGQSDGSSPLFLHRWTEGGEEQFAGSERCW